MGWVINWAMWTQHNRRVPLGVMLRYQKDFTNASPILSKTLYSKIWFRNYCKLLLQYFTFLLNNTLKEFVWRGIYLFNLHNVLHNGYCKSYYVFLKSLQFSLTVFPICLWNEFLLHIYQNFTRSLIVCMKSN